MSIPIRLEFPDGEVYTLDISEGETILIDPMDNNRRRVVGIKLADQKLLNERGVEALLARAQRNLDATQAHQARSGEKP